MGHPHFSRLRRLLLALALPVAGHVQAQNAEDQAFDAAVADGVSSAAVVMSGALPINPLVPVLSIGMKAATFQYTKGLPEHEKPAAYAAATAMWSGAAVNNVCMTASFLTGGSFIPACVALGVAWGVKSWNDSERDRQFGGNCAVLRQFMYDPGAACSSTSVQRTIAQASRGVITAQELTAP